MDLHLVGGFLGSGKTTAIIEASRLLMERGKRVGVVTNDQGRYLVDTAFFRGASVPAVEVTGGCFCCNYEDLTGLVSRLAERDRPDVIFAESVGSCADIVATVVKPLRTIAGVPADLRSFSVFADCRLLDRHLSGTPLPFSADILYIFEKQIEEAGLLVVNKVDLLPREQLADLSARVADRYPDKQVLMHSALKTEPVRRWVATLEDGTATAPDVSLTIDYDRYGHGEAELAWMDCVVDLVLPEGRNPIEVVGGFVSGLTRELRERAMPVGHLKMLVTGEHGEAKISLTSADEAPPVPNLAGSRQTLLINARVQAGFEELRTIVREQVARAAESHSAAWAIRDEQAFHPGWPRPTHRMA